MEFADILQAISTVGFPIVMCVVMMWYIKYNGDKQSADIKELREDYNSQIAKISEAVNNNTIAINKLCDRMERT